MGGDTTDKKTRNDIVKTKDVKQAVEKVVLRPVEPSTVEKSIPEVPQASYRNPVRDMQKAEARLREHRRENLTASNEEEGENNQ